MFFSSLTLNHMTKRFIVEDTGRLADPFQVRDTQTRAIVRSFTNLSDARMAAWRRNSHQAKPTWRTKLARWFKRTPVDEHTARRQRIADRCEQGQQRISKALFG